MPRRTTSDRKVRWRQDTSSSTPDASGQIVATYTDRLIWVNWTEISGTERDEDGILDVPVARAVAFTGAFDVIGGNDRITLIDEEPERTFRVLSVIARGHKRGWRIELESDDG